MAAPAPDSHDRRLDLTSVMSFNSGVTAQCYEWMSRNFPPEMLAPHQARGDEVMRSKKLSLMTPFMAIVIAAALAAPPSEAKSRGRHRGDGFGTIAETAFLYGFPMVMNYEVFYQYFIDRTSPAFKAPLNQLHNTAHVYTPKDTTIVTPNSDTPYSFVAMDLRAEPYVVCNPEIEKERYFSIQLVDMYTFNYGYMGSRTTGNGPACFLIAGPAWEGEKPEGIARIFRSETDFSIAVIRTQLFTPADIENVKKIQAGYRGLPLSKFLNREAPPAAHEIEWPKIDKALAETDPFAYLNFLLQLCPPTGPAAVEKPLRARFARIGVEAGRSFPPDDLTEPRKAKLEAAMKRGLERIRRRVATLGRNENGWRVVLDGFGDRRAYHGNWPLRAAAAMAGIYGNSPAEAVYPLLAADSDGNKPDAGAKSYTLTFPAGKLPPVHAFWSVTMYDAKTQLLVENPINRYLINSAMLPNLKKNADGSVTLYLQKDSPGAERESNWLPAPDGPIYVVMRLYWPKETALSGEWLPPPVKAVKGAGAMGERVMDGVMTRMGR